MQTAEVKPVATITPIPADRALVVVKEPEKPAPKETWLDQVLVLLGGMQTLGTALCAALVTGVWLSLFTMGIAIPSEPFRRQLLTMQGPGSVLSDPVLVIESLLVVAFAYTPTNLALLGCAASLVGCLGRMATTNADRPKAEAGDAAARAERTDKADEASPAAPAAAPAPRAEERPDASLLAPAMSAVTWGFFVYLVLISGTIVLTGDPFRETSPEQYFRLAGSASLFAFAVGWQPQILNQLVANVSKAGMMKGK